MPFVKLDAELLRSTLWLDSEARIVFITALLMAEPFEYLEPVATIEVRSLDPTGWSVPAGWYGLVRAAGPGIVRAAAVDREEGLEALDRLAAPEAESRSKDFDGRRLARVDGGYLVLNYIKYRDRDHTSATRSKRWREREKLKRAEASRRDSVTLRRDDTQADSRKNMQTADLNGSTAVEEVKRGEEEKDAHARPAIIGADGTLREIETGTPIADDLGLPGVARPPAQDRAARIAEAYLRTFNTVFGRKVAALSMQRAIVKRIKARLKDGIEGPLLVALPILARAEGSADFLGRDPLILLRDGKNAKTRDGTTFGATDHALGFAGRIDQITVSPRLTEAAVAAGVSKWLQHQGVTLKNPGPAPPPEGVAGA